MLKRIGVLTSGGDSPGMNAATRAVVRTAIHSNVEVFGIRNGYKGLIEGDIFEMNTRSVSDIIQRGGTVLGTARSKEFTTPNGRCAAYEMMKKFGIEGLVVIGGDGSLRGAQALSEEQPISVVGLPGTIDNDIWGMDYTIGCDTAANTIVDAINKLRDTASAHQRIAILEVMGRHCGWLALIAGVAGGAEFILVPEESYDVDEICTEITQMYAQSRHRYVLIVIAEGAGSGIELGKTIEKKTGIETRASVLGHIQRGGSPTVEDRVYASLLGEEAALALISGVSNVVFSRNNGMPVSVNLHDAVTRKRKLNMDLFHMAKLLA